MGGVTVTGGIRYCGILFLPIVLSLKGYYFFDNVKYIY